jgi:hypothetical protein
MAKGRQRRARGPRRYSGSGRVVRCSPARLSALPVCSTCLPPLCQPAEHVFESTDPTTCGTAWQVHFGRSCATWVARMETGLLCFASTTKTRAAHWNWRVRLLQCVAGAFQHRPEHDVLSACVPVAQSSGAPSVWTRRCLDPRYLTKRSTRSLIGWTWITVALSPHLSLRNF